jgi:hypothetical protein
VSSFYETADKVPLRVGLRVHVAFGASFLDGERPYFYRFRLKNDHAVIEEDGVAYLSADPGGVGAKALARLRAEREEVKLGRLRLRQGVPLSRVWADPLRAVQRAAIEQMERSNHLMKRAFDLYNAQPSDIDIKDLD